MLKKRLRPVPKLFTLTPESPAPVPDYLNGVRIAFARGDAFAFIYRANVDVLRAMGAEVSFCSPLNDHQFTRVRRALVTGWVSRA